MTPAELLFTPKGRRRLLWELRGRLASCVRFRYDRDLWIESPRQNRSARKAFLQGFNDPAMFAWLDGYLRPGMNALDVGANVGLYGLYLAKRVGPQGKVIAFEADPDTAAILQRNRDANGLEQLQIVVKAVGREAGNLTFQADRRNRGASHVAAGGEAGTRTVPVVTLDSFFEDNPIERLDYVKFDLEGFEFEALQGFRQTLARFPQCAVQTEISHAHLARYGRRAETLRSLLEDTGRRAWQPEADGLKPYDWSLRSGDALWLRE